MMQAIYKLADDAGFPNNDCIVCHGGDPLAKTKELAHAGTVNYFKENKGPKNFYPDPGTPTINEHTCGVCHEEQVRTQFTSLMYTEAGKIQGTTWGFGALQGYEHNVANTHVEEVVVHERLGTEVYKKYMAQLKEAEPQVFPSEMKALPQAPTAEEVKERPELSVYTYLRQECQRCHTGVKGRFKNGDFRGIGCSACHIPYSNKGYYEGGDSTIPHDEPGHMLVHSMQSTRDATVLVNGKTYSGIPVKTCQSCHNRGRRIGVSYEGLMETSYQSPFMGNADNQEKIHTKNYMHLQSDIHLKKGMLCQDCHTSGDAHSYGDLSGAIQGAVEIECTDCHGTPTQYPWELPIGYGDEVVGEAPRKGAPRGVSDSLLPHQHYGTVYPSQDGYLLTARGNPYANVVRKGNKAVLYTASGKDIEFKPLKYLADNKELSQEAVVAKIQVHMHIEKMECYACHATWAPQCYGCHINIDYSEHGKKPDWVEIAGIVDEHGLTPDAVYGGFKNIDKRSDLSAEDIEKIKSFMIAGEVQEQRSFLRWENPPLVINGEKRVSPAIPGCQTTVTVKDADGKVQLLNHIFKVPHVEGAGEEGQLAIDMAPLQPHTIQKKSRSCESCHSDPKAMGFGMNGGELYARPDTNVVIDLVDGEGRPLANNVDTMFNAIPNLEMGWSRYLDEDGRQLQTVGHHFSGSRPLNKEELMRLDRRGVCLSCHKSIPEGDLAVNLMTHVGEYADIQIDNERHNSILSKSNKIAAWAQVLGILLAIFLPFWLIRRWWKKRNGIF
ncbi:MAG: cytochrome C [Aureispira sp.]|nr:cytochrome C [Aureispira sp.]